jgi:hypothetical protein
MKKETLFCLCFICIGLGLMAFLFALDRKDLKSEISFAFGTFCIILYTVHLNEEINNIYREVKI